MMKAMILAGGTSQRLKGFYRGLPKVLLPVNGRPILEHNLRYLKKSGIRDITLNLHYRPDLILRFLKKKNFLGYRIHVSMETKLMGTAGAVKKVESRFKKSSFLVLYGDNLLDFKINRLLQSHLAKRSLLTLGVYNPLKTRWSGIAAGLVRVDRGGRIEGFVEKRSNRVIDDKTWVNGGIMILTPGIFRYIPKRSPCDFGKDVFPNLLRHQLNMHAASGATYVLASDTVQSWKRTVRIAKELSL